MNNWLRRVHPPAFDIIWRALFIFVFLAYSLYLCNFSIERHKHWTGGKYGPNFFRAMFWLEANSNHTDVVLADWELGAQIVAHIRRPVIATSKVYPSEAREVGERYIDVRTKFFKAPNEVAALKIIRKYQVKYVLFNKQRTSAKQAWLWRMKQKGRMEYFDLVYDSHGFMIYKVRNAPSQVAEEDLKKLFSRLPEPTSFVHNVVGAVLPHPPAVIFQTVAADFFNSLALHQNVKTVIIMGPAHFVPKWPHVNTSMAKVPTAFGDCEVDSQIVRDLMGRTSVTPNEEIQATEHSVRSLLPLLKYKFPNAKFVPLLFGRDVTAEQAKKIGTELARYTAEDTLFIASTDFSHGMTSADALSHDRSAAESVILFDEPGILRSHIDCTQAVLALLECLKTVQATDGQIMQVTNSHLLDDKAKMVVGYVSIVFLRKSNHE